MPGPLLTFSGYLGTVMTGSPTGWQGDVFALVATLLSSSLVLLGALPFWHYLHHWRGSPGALQGINACVVGILLAALYTPVWTSAILDRSDFGLALACAGLLMIWKLPPWMVVLFAAVGGEVLSRIG